MRQELAGEVWALGGTLRCEVKEVSGVRCSVSKRPVAGWAGWVRNNRSLFVSLRQSNKGSEVKGEACRYVGSCRSG